MIDFIRGKIAELSPTGVILDVNGIGYEINITLPTYSLLVDKTESKFFVYESIRDDSHDLYGFLTKGERQLFLALITVSGVGPGSARMILSTYTAAEIRQLIAVGNAKALSQVGTTKIDAAAAVANSVVYDEAVQALVALGYASAPVSKTVQKLLADNPSLTVEQVIKQAFKLL